MEEQIKCAESFCWHYAEQRAKGQDLERKVPNQKEMAVDALQYARGYLDAMDAVRSALNLPAVDRSETQPTPRWILAIVADHKKEKELNP